MDIHGVAGFQLHAERHFILGDAGHGFGIAELLMRMAVDVIHRIQHLTPRSPG